MKDLIEFGSVRYSTQYLMNLLIVMKLVGLRTPEMLP